jgi:hypothetical protein
MSLEILFQYNFLTNQAAPSKIPSKNGKVFLCNLSKASILSKICISKLCLLKIKSSKHVKMSAINKDKTDK